jgi:hypothetical protein
VHERCARSDAVGVEGRVVGQAPVLGQVRGQQHLLFFGGTEASRSLLVQLGAGGHAIDGEEDDATRSVHTKSLHQTLGMNEHLLNQLIQKVNIVKYLLKHFFFIGSDQSMSIYFKYITLESR